MRKKTKVLENSFVFVCKEKGQLQLPRDVWKWLLQGTSPPSCPQSLIRSNQHRREKLLSRLISQNGASVMGNKWTTTVNCSSLLHALWLIQSQRERLLEQHCSELYERSITVFLGNIWIFGKLTGFEWENHIEWEVFSIMFCHFAIVNFIVEFSTTSGMSSHTHFSARLPIVSTMQASLQAKASEVMRNVDLILSSSPHCFWESRQGVKKKRSLCFSHCAANKRGWDWEKRTHTPPAIKSLEFVLSAQNPSAAERRRGNVKIRWEVLRGY